MFTYHFDADLRAVFSRLQKKNIKFLDERKTPATVPKYVEGTSGKSAAKATEK